MILDLEIRIEQGPAANDAPSGNECQGRKLADIIIHSRKEVPPHMVKCCFWVAAL